MHAVGVQCTGSVGVFYMDRGSPRESPAIGPKGHFQSLYTISRLPVSNCWCVEESLESLMKYNMDIPIVC